MDRNNLKLATKLRHELHSHPELSMQETWTKGRLMDFLKQYTDLEVIDRGCWFYAVYHAGENRPNVAFRADFDALPINEPGDLVPYASKCPGVSHKCGHDGHSAVMAGFAMEVSQTGADKNIYFLFQPGEETGEGAIQCISFIKDCGIEEIYAFHNLAGYPKGWVAVRDGTMNCASIGMTIRMTGTPAHASTPENGINPAFALAEIVRVVPEFTRPEEYEGIILCTIVQLDIGQCAFGTAASDGVLRMTIRAQYEQEMEHLRNSIEQLAAEQAKKYGLRWEIAYQDAFPETANDAECVEKIRAACRENNFTVVEMAEPTRASEDFGHFLKLTKGAAFSIGIGEDYAPLHSTYYNFPDDIIETAVDVYMAIARE